MILPLMILPPLPMVLPGGGSWKAVTVPYLRDWAQQIELTDLLPRALSPAGL